MDAHRPPTTATEVECECGHETTVFPSALASEATRSGTSNASLAIADEDGLFVCPGCARSVYVPTASLN